MIRVKPATFAKVGFSFLFSLLFEIAVSTEVRATPVFSKEFSLQVHKSEVTASEVDGESLFVADRDGYVSKTNLRSQASIWRRYIRNNSGGPQGIRALTLSFDSLVILVATSWGELLVIDAHHGEILKRWTSPSNIVFNAITFSREVEYAVGADTGGALYLIHLITGNLEVIGYHEWPISTIRFYSDDFVLVADPSLINLWSISQRKVVTTLMSGESAGYGETLVQSLGISANLDLAVAITDQGVLVYNLVESRPDLLIPGEVNLPFQHAELIDQDRKVLTTDASGTVKIHEIDSGRQYELGQFFTFSVLYRIKPLRYQNYFLLAGLRLDPLQGGWIQIAEVWKIQD